MAIYGKSIKGTQQIRIGDTANNREFAVRF